MSKRWKNAVVIIVLAVSVVLVLWLTLFSRLGNYSRRFYSPFSSYRAVFNGSSRALLEVFGNIILFIPVGVMLLLIFRLDLKRSLIFGFTLSLIIESCQWFFWLGSFEIDDLIHNTIGTGLGSFFIKRTTSGEKLNLRNRKRSAAAFLVLTTIIIVSFFAHQGLRWQEMKRLTALNDRDDGKKNLLVLSPDSSYIGKSDVNVIYNSDGSILIEGSSENRAWIQIGTMKLMPGQYVLTGLSDMKESTIALVLDAYDSEEGRSRRITQEVGAITESEFVVEKGKVIRALISIYPGNTYSVTARPAVFKIE